MYDSRRWLVRVESKSAMVSAVSRMTPVSGRPRRGRGEGRISSVKFHQKALQLRVIPQHVRAVGQFDAAGQALLNQQGFADLFDQVSLAADQQLPSLEARGNGHHPIKGLGDPALVVGKATLVASASANSSKRSGASFLDVIVPLGSG